MTELLITTSKASHPEAIRVHVRTRNWLTVSVKLPQFFSDPTIDIEVAETTSTGASHTADVIPKCNGKATQ